MPLPFFYLLLQSLQHVFLLFKEVLELLLFESGTFELGGDVRVLDQLGVGHVLVVQVVGLGAPLEEELSPLLHAERSCEWDLLNDIPGCLRVVEAVGEPGSFQHDIGPNRLGGPFDLHLLSVILTVPKESPEFIAVQFL